MTPEEVREVWSNCTRPEHVAAIYFTALGGALDGSIPALREWLARTMPLAEDVVRESVEDRARRIRDVLREMRASVPEHPGNNRIGGDQ